MRTELLPPSLQALNTLPISGVSLLRKDFIKGRTARPSAEPLPDRVWRKKYREDCAANSHKPRLSGNSGGY